jgi:hypothetical protein
VIRAIINELEQVNALRGFRRLRWLAPGLIEGIAERIGSQAEQKSWRTPALKRLDRERWTGAKSSQSCNDRRMAKALIKKAAARDSI